MTTVPDGLTPLPVSFSIIQQSLSWAKMMRIPRPCLLLLAYGQQHQLHHLRLHNLLFIAVLFPGARDNLDPCTCSYPISSTSYPVGICRAEVHLDRRAMGRRSYLCDVLTGCYTCVETNPLLRKAGVVRLENCKVHKSCLSIHTEGLDTWDNLMWLFVRPISFTYRYNLTICLSPQLSPFVGEVYFIIYFLKRWERQDTWLFSLCLCFFSIAI